MINRPRILLTNDDGVWAKGIRELIEVMQLFGDVTVVAPELAQSSKSNAITTTKPLRAKLLEEEEGLKIYSTNGTPVDCVKMALDVLLENRPDFIISGINHGTNAAVSILYSGTMGAAIEGCIHGIPSIGFSLCDYSADADFSKAKSCIVKIFQQIATNGITPGTCLNINVPQGSPIGFKICRQTQGKWVEEFDHRTDPAGKDYYWLTGHFKNFEPDATDTDIHALEEGYVAIVPVTIDMTAYTEIELLKKWNF